MYFSISLFISVKDKSPCFAAHSQHESSEGKGKEKSSENRVAVCAWSIAQYKQHLISFPCRTFSGT